MHIAEYHDCALLQNTCIKNKDSRAAVKFGQKTGSRSYAAHLYATISFCILLLSPQAYVLILGEHHFFVGDSTISIRGSTSYYLSSYTHIYSTTSLIREVQPASSFLELPDMQLETAPGANAEPKHKDIIFLHLALLHHSSPVSCDHCTVNLPFALENPQFHTMSLTVRDKKVIIWKVHIPRDVLLGKLPVEVHSGTAFHGTCTLYSAHIKRNCGALLVKQEISGFQLL